MTKKIVISTILSAVLMFGFPALANGATITNVNAVAFIIVAHFYVSIPLLMVFIGIFTGGEFKRLWFVPIIPVAMFVAAMLLWLSSMITSWQDFLLYSLGYLAIGEIAGLLTFLMKKQKIKNKGKDNG